MNISGILDILDALPEQQRLEERIRSREPLEPLGLLRGSRHAVLAKLVTECKQPLVLLTGRGHCSKRRCHDSAFSRP